VQNNATFEYRKFNLNIIYGADAQIPGH